MITNTTLFIIDLVIDKSVYLVRCHTFIPVVNKQSTHYYLYQ